MQTQNAQSSRNMKLMTLLMPIFFFFILYNAPAGLLLYWTMTNIFTAGQQYVVSYLQKKNPDKGESGKPNSPKKGR